VVERDPVPAPVLAGNRRDAVAGGGEHLLKPQQPRTFAWAERQIEADSEFHI
jgi:hypothetical protein